MVLSAFYGEIAVRDAAIQRLSSAVDGGKLIAGYLLWDGKQGSAAGVMAETAELGQWQQRLGLPSWFACAIDLLTQQLSPKVALEQISGILMAISPARELSTVGSILICLLLKNMAATVQPEGELTEAMIHIVALHQRCARGEIVAPGEWRKARVAAGKSLKILMPDLAEDAEPLSMSTLKMHVVSIAIEAAAWDPSTSPSSLADVIRQWLQLELFNSDDEFGWTELDSLQIQTHLQEMDNTYLKESFIKGEAGESVFDLLEKHRPEVHARMKAYEQHGYAYQARCAVRAFALFRSHVLISDKD